VQENFAQAGLCANTIVLKMDGELLAHNNAHCDRITTLDANMVVLFGVRRKRVICDAVQIKAVSFEAQTTIQRYSAALRQQTVDPRLAR